MRLCLWAVLALVALGHQLWAQAPAPPTLEKLLAPTDVKAPMKLPQTSPAPEIIPPGACTVPLPPKEWSGNFDFGLNGTSGNSESMNFRLFADTKRERPDCIFTANLLYNYATANGVVNQNMFLGNSRYEWLFPNSPWSYWVSGGFQYDQFRAFDLLIYGHTGLGYQWWKNDVSFLKTRTGFGGSYPIGGPDERFTPEALLGLDYEHKFGDRFKFVFSGVLYPDLSDFFEYRALVQTALECLVAPEYNLGLKLGIVDNYISNPQGRKPNDLNYFLALMWKY